MNSSSRNTTTHLPIRNKVKIVHLTEEEESPQIEQVPPSHYGFNPEKFPSYRPGQLEVAHQVANSSRLLYLEEAPTGSGKSLGSLTAFQITNYSNEKGINGLYLVSTKQLQDQVQEDFNLPLLKGKSNYPCSWHKKAFPLVSAEICTEFKRTLPEGKCDKEDFCPYKMAKREAAESPMCILNYALFLTETNYGPRAKDGTPLPNPFRGRGFAIMDEIDCLEQELERFVEVTIPAKMIKDLSLGYPRYKTKEDSWKEWLDGIVIPSVDKHLKTLGTSVENLTRRVRISRLLKKAEYLSSSMSSNWVMEIRPGSTKNGSGGDAETGATFRPVKVAPFARSRVWDHIGRSLGMSATIIGAQTMALDLGLNSWETDYVSLPSPFPPSSREVWYTPVANVVRKEKDTAYPKLVTRVDELLEEHSKERVLIHTVSYDLTTYLLDHLRPQHHGLITHRQQDRALKLQEFKSSTEPMALLSPSMERGVDLPGDLCSVIIVCKMMYPDLSSPQVSKRLYGFADGQIWYAKRTIRNLCQSTGRHVRYLGDWGRSYILDSQFELLLMRWKKLFPQYWLDALVMP